MFYADNAVLNLLTIHTLHGSVTIFNNVICAMQIALAREEDESVYSLFGEPAASARTRLW